MIDFIYFFSFKNLFHHPYSYSFLPGAVDWLHISFLIIAWGFLIICVVFPMITLVALIVCMVFLTIILVFLIICVAFLILLYN